MCPWAFEGEFNVDGDSDCKRDKILGIFMAQETLNLRSFERKLATFI